MFEPTGHVPSPGVSRPLQVSVTRQSWEVWIDSTASLTDPSGGITTSFMPGNGAAEITVTVTATTPTVTEEWTYNRSEGIVVAILESVAGPASGHPVPAGVTVDFVLRARYDSWDVYLSNFGGQTTQNHASTCVEGALVNWRVGSGDGFITGLTTTDASGTAPATFTGDTPLPLWSRRSRSLPATPPPPRSRSPPRAGEDFPGDALLLGEEVEQPVKVHLLDRLRRRPVDLPGDVIPLRVGIDSELDRGVGFGRAGVCLILHGCRDDGFNPRLTTSCHLSVILLDLAQAIF